MKTSRAGLSVVELMLVLGLIAVVSVGLLSMMNNMFKSVSSAQKSANRTDIMKGISTALSNKETCKLAMGAGTLVIPASWSAGASNALNISRIQVGTETLAEIGKTINDIRVTAMGLQMVSGPYPVQYNIAPTGAPPNLRNYRRYFAKLNVTPVKVGGSQNNVGGETFKDSEFRMTFLVDDTNRLFDCFGGMDESDVAAICEKAFYGEYDVSQYPWCRINHLAIGMRMTDLPVMYRFAVKELPMASSPSLDTTMLLSGNPGGNGPGIKFLPTIGGGANMGAAEQAGRYANGTQPGDFAIAGYRDIHLATINGPAISPTRLTIKNNGQVGVATIDPKNSQLRVVNSSTSQHGLAVHHSTGQGNILVSGLSDAGETYSAIYLSDSNDTDPRLNSWVFAHKGPSAAGIAHNSLQVNRWSGGAMSTTAGLTITPLLNFGIGTSNPTEKLHVAGNVLMQGTLRVTGVGTFDSNVNVTGTVTASSDRRLKKEIQSLDSSLEKILKLKPVSFVWRNEHISSNRQIGLIAQDVEKVPPELVATSDSGTKSVAYGNLVAVVVDALKKIYELLVSSEARIQQLEKNLQILMQKQIESEHKQRGLETQLMLCQEGKAL